MVKMGEVGVPKLAFALKYNSIKRIRPAAAYCLGDIGSSEAVDAMKSALGDRGMRSAFYYVDVAHLR